MTGISAAILAGGGSHRFGADKALVPSPLDGRPILAWIVDRLQAVADDVTIVAPLDRSYERFGVDVISERIPNRGPLGGIETALAVARHDRCLIVACDLPLLRQELLGWMVRQPFEGDALVPLVPILNRVGQAGELERAQSLLAIYRTEILPAVRHLLDSGERRVDALLDAIHVTYLSEDTLRNVDPDLASFQGVNTAEDLAIATQIVRRLSSHERGGDRS